MVVLDPSISLAPLGIQATDTGGGQWTRLDLNSDALLEEEGAAPDMRFEELREGPLPVSRLAARHDASHEVRHRRLPGFAVLSACPIAQDELYSVLPHIQILAKQSNLGAAGFPAGTVGTTTSATADLYNRGDAGSPGGA